MAEPTFDDIEALVGPATPHFAFQLRARVRELIDGLPRGRPGAPVRRGEDPPPRRPRLRLVEGRGRRARRATDADRLGRDPVARRRRPGRCRARVEDRPDGRSVLVTGGSRGIGKAIALRFAREGATRVAIGYMRSDAAAEETAEELRALGAEPVLVRGNVTSERVLEQVRAARADRRLRPQRGDRRDPPRARDRGQALGLDAERERPRLPLAHPRARPDDAGRLVGGRDLEPRLDPGARELRARRHLEGGARVARALPRRRARAGRDSRQRGLGRRRRHRRARPLPEPRGDARDGPARTPPGGSSRPRTSPAPSRSSARPTPRWCAARR